MKVIQLLGFVVPVILLGFLHYLYGGAEPIAATAMVTPLSILWGSVAILAVVFNLLFVLPSSVILFKKENRNYFLFNSKRWLAVLFINSFLSIVYCIAIVVLIFTSYH